MTTRRHPPRGPPLYWRPRFFPNLPVFTPQQEARDAHGRLAQLLTNDEAVRGALRRMLGEMTLTRSI